MSKICFVGLVAEKAIKKSQQVFDVYGICSFPISFCKNCLQEIKSLELPKEKIYECQFCYVLEYLCNSYKITEKYYKDVEEFLVDYPIAVNWFEVTASKRERGKNE